MQKTQKKQTQKPKKKTHREGILITLLVLLILIVGLMIREVVVQLTAEPAEPVTAAAETAAPAQQTTQSDFQGIPEQAVISDEDSSGESGVLNETDLEGAALGSTGTSNTTSGSVLEGDGETEAGFGIYSYLQQTKSYEDGEYWSGDWCNISEPGSWKTFSSFGCGICCLSNMYSTITGDVCTPDKMYQWAKDDSDYAGNGAISWDQVKTVADAIGIGGTLCTAGDYSEFQQAAAESRTLMLLVSSYYDNAIWHNVAGHYVNIWSYNADTDTAFLTDSSFKDNNRSRVALKDVYNALYLADDYQYMKIDK